MPGKTIFLVDDHVIVRNGIKGIIESIGDYKVEREFDNGKVFTDEIPFKPAPDLIILDLAMPLMDGKSTMQWMRARQIKYPVLVLTVDTSDQTIIELFKLGVRGYLPKSCSAEVLKTAIDDVLNTGYYHNELLTNALANDKYKHSDEEIQDMLNKLTEREVEFLKYVTDTEEYTYEQIASKMNVSRRTVDGYREEVFRKFKVKSKTGIVLFAIKYGLLNII